MLVKEQSGLKVSRVEEELKKEEKSESIVTTLTVKPSKKNVIPANKIALSITS